MQPQTVINSPAFRNRPDVDTRAPKYDYCRVSAFAPKHMSALFAGLLVVGRFPKHGNLEQYPGALSGGVISK